MDTKLIVSCLASFGLIFYLCLNILPFSEKPYQENTTYSDNSIIEFVGTPERIEYYNSRVVFYIGDLEFRANNIKIPHDKNVTIIGYLDSYNGRTWFQVLQIRHVG